MLSQAFDVLLDKIKNPALEHPVFYHCPVAIRFAIGPELPVYREASPSDELVANPQYIESALRRAKAIYAALPHAPNLLRIDTCPSEDTSGSANDFDAGALEKLLPAPHEQRRIQRVDDGEQQTAWQCYWDLCQIDFSLDLLLKEIIRADLGGVSALASSVYFAGTEAAYLYHVYDDRGADLVAEHRETLRPIYQKFGSWILEYNRREIDALFA